MRGQRLYDLCLVLRDRKIRPVLAYLHEPVEVLPLHKLLKHVQYSPHLGHHGVGELPATARAVICLYRKVDLIARVIGGGKGEATLSEQLCERCRIWLP